MLPRRYAAPMPRTARAAAGGWVYHVLNRGNGRMGVFRKPEDYQAFVDLLAMGRERANIELFGFCLMPNHWHLVVRPAGDGDLAAYLSWVTNTHVKRYRAHYRRTSGHLYQGRYKSFPVQEDAYFLTLLRYVEANPLRAKLVARAQDWRWSSLGCDAATAQAMLSPWPLRRPANWARRVNEALPGPQQQRVESSLGRGRPLGDDQWAQATARRLGLQYTLNPRGRPPKPPAGGEKR
jgi:putative transposase